MGNYDKAYASLDETQQDPQKKLEGVLRYLLTDIKKAETERIFVETWSMATRDEVARSLLDEMYCYHRKQLERLIAEAYPKLRKEKIALRACLVAMQIEGLMLVLADSKPRHPELKGIDEECLRSIHAVLSAP